MAATIEGINLIDGDYRYIGRLARGRAGVVERAIDESWRVCDGMGCNDVAVKVYAPDGEDAFHRETTFLTILNGHPNVVSLLASHSSLAKAIVMPFYGERDLFWTVVEDGPLKSSEARNLTRDMLRGLQHIHGLEILHCDVKPTNVMITTDGRGVLVDFDQARWCWDNAQTMAESITPGFTAPEVILRQNYSSHSDVFSAGCILCFTLAQTHPFVGGSQHPEAVLRRNAICRVSCNLRSNNISSECKSLILSLLLRDPHKRPSTGYALKHTWLAKSCKHATVRSSEDECLDVPTAPDCSSYISPTRPSQKPSVSKRVAWAKDVASAPARACSAGFGFLCSTFRREGRSGSVVRNADFTPVVFPQT
eukprot:TRINITY_DN13472_c0_g1_i1.p1 TRINITY_DN13472_c0_g1~~TRINITY_DN13472_c0_g1_i1.p1  ORF type:complete len:365 (+),score=32.95 TRINITY_DN13472_c0_g1_i1:209-1303(+)